MVNESIIIEVQTCFNNSAVQGAKIKQITAALFSWCQCYNVSSKVLIAEKVVQKTLLSRICKLTEML